MYLDEGLDGDSHFVVVKGDVMEESDNWDMQDKLDKKDY